VATKSTTANTPSTPHKSGLLRKRFNLPVKGTLSKSVKTPRWLRAIGRYFAGAWRELREVHWPTRRAAWGLTMAVVLFTIALGFVIIGLDFGFEQLFKRILF
jgi:preprotein translocase SecE subunit